MVSTTNLHKFNDTGLVFLVFLVFLTCLISVLVSSIFSNFLIITSKSHNICCLIRSYICICSIIFPHILFGVVILCIVCIGVAVVNIVFLINFLLISLCIFTCGCNNKLVYCCVSIC